VIAMQQIFAPRPRITRRERERRDQTTRPDLRPWSETPAKSARWRKPL
jgi:hypothetical protein